MDEEKLPFAVEYHPAEDGPDKNITIVIQQTKFASFITRLLGQPQTIERSFDAVFELDHEWLNNLHKLIMQRVSRQNTYSLVQFSAAIEFRDGLVRTVNSFEAFQSFVETKPLVSTGCRMKWTLLVLFSDKQVPEKQEITLKVATDLSEKPLWRRMVGGGPGAGNITINVAHTERTWGDDITGLIVGHIESRVVKPGKIRWWVNRHCFVIGQVAAGASFIAGVISRNLLRNWMNPEAQEAIAAHAGGADLEVINKKLDILLWVVTKSSVPEIVSLLVAIIGAMVSLFVLPRVLGATSPSFVIFNRTTQEYAAKAAKKDQRRRQAGDALLIGIAGSLVASAILAIYNS